MSNKVGDRVVVHTPGYTNPIRGIVIAIGSGTYTVAYRTHHWKGNKMRPSNRARLITINM